MWSPTHIQVTVQRARNLQNKGRKGTNDAFVLIQMGKEKFQTSVKDKTIDPEWYEECDLTLVGRDSNVTLTVYHRNVIGLDEFLGQTSVPLQGIESYDRPFTKWYTLKGKTERSEEKCRGELEVRIAFIVQNCKDTQSLNDLSFSKKKRHSLKNMALSVGHKIQKLPNHNLSLKLNSFDPRKRLERLREKKSSTESETDSKDDDDFDVNTDYSEEFAHVPMKRHGAIYSSTLSLPQSAMITSSIQEAVSTEDLAHESENQDSSDNSATPDVKEMNKPTPRRLSVLPAVESKLVTHGEWTNRILSHMKESPLARSENNLADIEKTDSPVPATRRSSKLETLRKNLRRHTLQLSEPPDLSLLKIPSHNKKINNDTLKNDWPKKLELSLPKGIPRELIQEYDKMNHKDLVILAIKQQVDIEKQRDKIADLENYLDNLLVRVMETTPRILQKPYASPLNPACHRGNVLFVWGIESHQSHLDSRHPHRSATCLVCTCHLCT